jgi:hypothetical protein
VEAHEQEEGSTARNAVSRVFSAEILPRSLAKEDRKKEDKKRGPEGRVYVFMKKASRVYRLVSLYPRRSELPISFVALVKESAC